MSNHLPRGPRFSAARRFLLAAVATAALATIAGAGAASADRGTKHDDNGLGSIDHIVVIYEENHSFDNLYGGWEGVNGRANADAAHTTQVDQAGVPYGCLAQNDVNLTSPPLAATCTDSAHTLSNGSTIASAFPNGWFTIDGYIPPTATTCPKAQQAFAFPNGILNGARDANGNLIGLPGGCTRDLVHKFYQEQYQLNGGSQNRYMVGSDAIGLTMGVYDTKALPIYRYLHGGHHPQYAIADNFFQAAFGGSFLNHQWLIAAASPTYPHAPANFHSAIDSAGFPRNNYPLYKPVPGVTYRDGDLTVTCPSPAPGLACGDWAVNTMQPSFEPSGTFGDKLIPQSHATIGDRLTAKNIDWAWYAGGWSNAAGIQNGPGWTNGNGPTCSDPNHDPAPKFVFPQCPDLVFQYHHQPFVYFQDYAPGTPGRTHLRDEEEFIQTAQSSGSHCNLKAVSFVKPIGQENEHPGYASEPNGSDHLVELLQAVQGSACAGNTMVIVTYDEFGGAWDHVSPPGQGNDNGPHDQFGPGTRVPALVIAPHLRGNFVVDHTSHDTTSILATIEHRYDLAPLGTRDAAVKDLSSVFDARQVAGGGDGGGGDHH